jgi:hypothetical protein
MTKMDAHAPIKTASSPPQCVGVFELCVKEGKQTCTVGDGIFQLHGIPAPADFFLKALRLFENAARSVVIRQIRRKEDSSGIYVVL